MYTALFGLILAVSGGIGMWDAWRITSTKRVAGAFDPIGPDHYLMSVAALVFALGLCLMVQGLRARRASAAGAGPVAEDDGAVGDRHLWLTGVLLVYLPLLTFAGYVPATALFFLATLRIMGITDWRALVASAIGLTALFHVLFVRLADMPLPRGPLGY